MGKKEIEDIKRHVAGAVFKHQSPFESLISFSNKIELAQNFINKWTVPFYLNLNRTDEEWKEFMLAIIPDLSDEIILDNLGDFNWRTRSTGAYFSGIIGEKKFIDIIGIHLLKSEVCYAGAMYSKILALFNDANGNEYLDLYLQYYLKRNDLYFDQKEVLTAIKYLDEINGTNRACNYEEDWLNFISNKHNWQADITTLKLESEINFIKDLHNSMQLN